MYGIISRQKRQKIPLHSRITHLPLKSITSQQGKEFLSWLDPLLPKHYNDFFSPPRLVWRSWPSNIPSMSSRSVSCTHTSQDSSPTSPRSSFGPHLYAIHDIPGKGRGLVAGVSIAKGQRVIQKQPLFTSSLRWKSYQKFGDSLASTIAPLPPNKHETFFALQNATPDNSHPLIARFRTNCLPIRDESEAAIFATACLINHSCQANLSGGWNPEAMAQPVHATRAIKGRRGANDQLCSRLHVGRA